MKKLLIILVFFTVKSFAFAQLDENKLWALALTGIMTEINRGSHTTLNSNLNLQNFKEIYTEVLRRDWGIHNRDELIEMLVQMENDGHAGQLLYLKQLLIENNNDVQFIISNYELSPLGQNRLNFLSLNFELYRNVSISSWDLGRNIAICRWGYDAGYLNEDEAWEKIMYYAELIQPLYQSWREYGYSYYLGRIFWASAFGSVEEYVRRTDEVYNKLFSETGYWSNLNWNVKL